MNSKLLLLALLCAAVCAHAAEGQVYKWTDAAGIVHYSDAPPPKDTQNVQTVRVTGGDRPHAVASENTESSAAKPEGDGAAPAAAAAAANPAEAELRKKNCQTARANLELLQSNYPVAMADGKALDDSGRKAQISEANAQVAFYCR